MNKKFNKINRDRQNQNTEDNQQKPKNIKKMIGISTIVLLVLSIIMIARSIWVTTEPLRVVGRASSNTLEAIGQHFETTYPFLGHEVWRSPSMAHSLYLSDFAIGDEDRGILDTLMGRFEAKIELKKSESQWRGSAELLMPYGKPYRYAFYKDETLTAINKSALTDMFIVQKRHVDYEAFLSETIYRDILEIVLAEIHINEEVGTDTDTRQFSITLSEEGVKQVIAHVIQSFSERDMLAHYYEITHGDILTEEEQYLKQTEIRDTLEKRLAQIQIEEGLKVLIQVDENEYIVGGHIHLNYVEDDESKKMHIDLIHDTAIDGVESVDITFTADNASETIESNLSYTSETLLDSTKVKNNLSLNIEGIEDKPIAFVLELVSDINVQERLPIVLKVNVGQLFGIILDGEVEVTHIQDGLTLTATDILLKIADNEWVRALDAIQTDMLYEVRRIEAEDLKPMIMTENNTSS